MTTTPAPSAAPEPGSGLGGRGRVDENDGAHDVHRREEVVGHDTGRVMRLEHEVDTLVRALRTRDVIVQAKGVLISHYGLADPDAFALLRHLSQDTNVKVVDVAAALVARVRRRCPSTDRPGRIVTSILEELRAGGAS